MSKGTWRVGGAGLWGRGGKRGRSMEREREREKVNH
jgi:hypothetical protein